MKLIKNTLFILLLLVVANTAFAQEDLTLYGMKSVNENMYLNPGRMPETRINISLPVVSSTSFGLSNSGFAFSDLVMKRASDDSLVLNTTNMLSKLSPENLISMSASTNILGVGVRVKRNYYSFSARAVTDFTLAYTKDMMQFILQGNTSFLGKQANLELKLNATAYAEYGFGVTHITKDGRLSYGGKLKILSGIANLNTKSAKLSVFTDSATYAMTATPDIQINSSLIDTGTINNNGAGSNIFGSNKGFAVDFGASYKVTNKLTVSASVIDFGFINWNSNVNNYQSDPNKTSFTFSGFDAVKFFNGSSIKPYLDTLSDSLKHTFYPNKTNNSYKTSLSTKVFAGANYTLAKGLDAGILLYGRFLDGQLYSGLALSLNEELGKILNVSASFSQINKTSNFGLGLSLNLLPIQIYLASDNIFAFTKVDEVRSTNVHFGLNVAIGRVKSN